MPPEPDQGCAVVRCGALNLQLVNAMPSELSRRSFNNWRLEGSSFVWYFRGRPHVHVWVNVADDASPKLNSYQNSIM